MSKVAGKRAKASWYNPRTGVSTHAGEFATNGNRQFNPPGDGDWVLVLEGS
jgi:hypothetical protein